MALAAVIAAVALAAATARQAGGREGRLLHVDGSSAREPVPAGTSAAARLDHLAISPGGRFAYLDGYGESPVPVLSVFRRSDDGTLHQLSGKKGCFSSDGSSEDGTRPARNARDLDSGDATSLVISRDGKFLYVASQLQVRATTSAASRSSAAT